VVHQIEQQADVDGDQQTGRTDSAAQRREGRGDPGGGDDAGDLLLQRAAPPEGQMRRDGQRDEARDVDG
jgi:hypothetical protein